MNSRIIFICENDLKREITLAKNLLRKESKLRILLEQFLLVLATFKRCVWLLLVAVTLPVTDASCERNLKKMKLLKNFPEIPWPVKDWVTLIYFKLKGTSWNTDLDDFVDEFDSRHDKRRIKLRWGDDDIKFERCLCRDLCENYIAHCLFVWIIFGLEVVRVSRMTRQS